MSGDVAVDLLDPWRRPALLLVYARAGAVLASAGLVPVAERQSATAALVVAADPGVWAPLSVPPRARPERCPVQVADGLQILFDVHNAPGPDADEAARRWRRQHEHQASLS